MTRIGSGNTLGTPWPWPGTTSWVDLDQERPSFTGNDLGRERPLGSTLTGNDLPSPGTTLAGNDLLGRPWPFSGEVFPLPHCSWHVPRNCSRSNPIITPQWVMSVAVVDVLTLSLCLAWHGDHVEGYLGHISGSRSKVKVTRSKYILLPYWAFQWDGSSSTAV